VAQGDVFIESPDSVNGTYLSAKMNDDFIVIQQLNDQAPTTNVNRKLERITLYNSESNFGDTSLACGMGNGFRVAYDFQVNMLDQANRVMEIVPWPGTPVPNLDELNFIQLGVQFEQASGNYAKCSDVYKDLFNKPTNVKFTDVSYTADLDYKYAMPSLVPSSINITLLTDNSVFVSIDNRHNSFQVVGNEVWNTTYSQFSGG